LEIDIDQNGENQQRQVPIRKSTPFPRDIVDEMDKELSYSTQVVVNESPLGGTKIFHKMETSNSDKELIPSKILDLPFSNTISYCESFFTGVARIRGKKEILKITFLKGKKWPAN